MMLRVLVRAYLTAMVLVLAAICIMLPFGNPSVESHRKMVERLGITFVSLLLFGMVISIWVIE